MCTVLRVLCVCVCVCVILFLCLLLHTLFRAPAAQALWRKDVLERRSSSDSSGPTTTSGALCDDVIASACDEEVSA